MLRDAEVKAYAPVTDLDKGRQFYEGVLELKVLDANPGGVLFECANHSQFFMYKTEFSGTSKASCLFWDVDDAEKEVAELKAKGVKFERYDLPDMKMTSDIFDAGGTKNAWFKDPDGNILALIESPR
jgi:catechol 2,3-dioxygenase-like lactoylglutathione lyase family enzyme